MAASKETSFYHDAVPNAERRGTLSSVNLNKNLDAKYAPPVLSPFGLTNKHLRVSNPLADIPKDLLMRDVEEFATQSGLTDIIPGLKKGALIAQNPAGYEDLEKISQEEKDVLRHEILHKWRHPLKLHITIIVCSIGAAVQ